MSDTRIFKTRHDAVIDGLRARIADLEAALANCAFSKRDEDRARSQLADLRARAGVDI